MSSYFQNKGVVIMQHRVKKLLSLALLMSIGFMMNSMAAVPFLQPRSQSVDAARELVGETQFINQYDKDCWYWVLDIVPEYTRTFRQDRLTSCLFGNDLNCNCDCPTIKIQGSRIENRDPKAWLADYFGLPTTFSSEISFAPRVDTFLVDFGLYVGLDNWLEGLYFRIHGPVVHTRWRLDFCECNVSTGTQGYDEGYFADQAIAQSNLLNNATEFFSGRRAPTIQNLDGTTTKFQRLSASRWADCDCDDEVLRETGFADLEFALGWNFFQDCDYHFGLNIRAAAPTGNSPEGCYLFEPIVGNGDHWALGGGLTFHYTLWEDECNDREFGFYLDANFTHLFNARQCRVFDLCVPGENSRYMLAEKLVAPVGANLWASDTAGGTNAGTVSQPSAQFAREFAPVANLTKVSVDSSYGVQADVVALFDFSWCNWSWDFGYEFYGRSCEKIRERCECPARFDSEKWALKGDAHVYGFASTDMPFTGGLNTLANDAAIALSATESLASIHKGTNNFTGPSGNDGGLGGIRPIRNPGVDNSQFAQTTDGVLANGQQLITDRSSVTGLSREQTKTSNDPILLKNSDIDFCGARTRYISHKVFTNFSYAWYDDCRCWTPYLGVGFKVEFAGNRSCDDCETDCGTNSCNTTCNVSCNDDSDCQRCGLSEWGVWLKTGVAYN